MSRRTIWERLGSVFRARKGTATTDFIGPSYTRRQLLASEYLAPQDVRGVWAHPVPPLIGAIVEAPSERDLPSAIESLLHQRLPAFSWHVEPAITQAVRKYGLLHTSIPAPPDRPDEPMWLELAGDVVAFGEHRMTAQTNWLDLRPMSTDDRLDTEVPGPIRVKITVATYANTRVPRCGCAVLPLTGQLCTPYLERGAESCRRDDPFESALGSSPRDGRCARSIPMRVHSLVAKTRRAQLRTGGRRARLSSMAYGS